MNGETTARYGDSTMTSGTSGSWRSQRRPELLGQLQVVGDVDRPDVAGQRPAEVDGLDDRPVDAVDRDDHPLLAVRAGQDAVVADLELLRLERRTGGG